MSRREYAVSLRDFHKLIIGEGESDRNFFAEFCVSNGIAGFDYGFAGMHNPKFNPSGFDVFKTFLFGLPRLAGFDALQDLVLVCDSTDKPENRLTGPRRQIREANHDIGRQIFSETPNANEIATVGIPRVHVLMVPRAAQGGLESVCFTVAKEKLNEDGAGVGTKIAGWVDTFAQSACDGWTVEKKDKLRLQAMMSAAWPKKPEMHFSQLFDITRDNLVPLNGPSFRDIRDFLTAVAGL